MESCLTRHETKSAPPGPKRRPLPAWGLYARNVKVLQLENVRLGIVNDETRPALMAEHLGRMDLDSLRLPPGAPAPVILNDVGDVRSPAKRVTLVPARFLDLNVTATPLAAVVTVAGGEQEGLARVELSVDGQTVAKWVWLKAHELKSVSFTKLNVSATGPHRVRCGELVHDVPPAKH